MSAAESTGSPQEPPASGAESAAPRDDSQSLAGDERRDPEAAPTGDSTTPDDGGPSGAEAPAPQSEPEVADAVTPTVAPTEQAPVMAASVSDAADNPDSSPAAPREEAVPAPDAPVADPIAAS